MTSLAYAALWIFVFSVPWERILVLPGISIITRVTGGLAMGLAVLAVVISGRLRRWHPVHVAALLFWVWAGFGLLVINSGQRLPYKYWTYAQLIMVLWMIWELAPSKRRQLGLLTAYTLGAYVAAFDTILVYRREVGVLRRFAAGGADPNDLAMTLALALPMAWYLGMTYRQPLVRLAFRAYLPLAVVAIGLTGSRGGMLAATVGLLIVPLSMTGLSPGRLATAIAILAISGAVAVAYIPETLIERLATTGTELEGGRIGGRGKLWKAGIYVFADKPLFGYGTGNFKGAITPVLGEASQVAHNSYLSVLVEEGIVGFLLYMTMFVAIFVSLLNLPLLERRFALVLMATLFVAMLPLTWEDRKTVWVILAALLGLSQAYVGARAGPARQSPPRQASPLGGSPRRPLERLTVPGRGNARDATA